MDVPVYSVRAHTQVVNCIDAVAGVGHNTGAPEIVTGSRDGKNKQQWRLNYERLRQGLGCETKGSACSHHFTCR